MKKALYAVLATALSLSAMAPAMANDQPCDPCGPSASPTGAGDVADLARDFKSLQYEVNVMLERGDPLTIPLDASEAAIILAAACPNGCVTTAEMEDAKKRLMAVEDKLSSAQRKLASQGKRLDGLELVIAQTNSALFDLDERISHTEARLTGLEARAGAQATRTANLEEGVKATNARVDRVEGEVRDQAGLQLGGKATVGIGAGGYTGTNIYSGWSVPLTGALGGEMRVRGQGSQILVLDLSFIWLHDPKLKDLGSGVHMGVGGVLNPMGKKDLALVLGGEAMRVSSSNQLGFADANRYEVRVGPELRYSFMFGRTKMDVVAYARFVASKGTMVVGGMEYVPFTKLGGEGGLQFSVAIGSRWRHDD